MAATPAHPVTNDELIKHRLQELEQLAAGWHAAERKVDSLNLSLASVEKTVTEIQADLKSRDDRLDAGMARLHDRLDEALREQAREEGREEGRAQMRAEAFEEGRVRGLADGEKRGLRETMRVVAFTLGTTIAASGVIVALLALILKH